MATLLSYLGDLGIHRLLMGRHGVKLGGQLVDGCTQDFISLSLCRYELHHHALQMGRRRLRWRWWGVGGSRLKPRWTYGIWRRRVGVPVRGVGIALPPLIVGSGLGVMM